MAGNADDPGHQGPSPSDSGQPGAGPSGSGQSHSGPSGSDRFSTNSDTAGAGQGQEPAWSEQTAPKKPLARTFHCTNCGGPVTIRYPGASLSVVCPNCHSIIDAMDENCTVLIKYFKATSIFKPVLELGTRGKLKGRTWEVIGYMVRTDAKSSYQWDEYLLFNPYYGFRWLTEDNGQWNFVRTIKRKPDSDKSAVAILGDKTYKLFNSGIARVDYVIGEFYWRVAMGSQVTMNDYLKPPEMLSSERDDNEVVWSISEYITPKEVKDAFSPNKDLPRPFGLNPTEPEDELVEFQKIRLLFLIFCVVVTCAQFHSWRMADNTRVLDYTNTFVPNTKKTDTTTPVFVLERDKGNVAITTSAPVRNSWFWIGGEMVNNDTGESYPFEQSVEYYYGTDSDGAWSEGGNTSTLQISSVPKGKYYINLDYESGSFVTTDPQPFEIAIYRNVPTFENWLWTLFFLSVLPVISFMKMRRTEVERWSNSDYSPYEPRDYTD